MNLKKNHYSRRALALLLTLVMCVGMIPTAFAAQQNSYHDPAEHWMQASGRTNELDANSVVTRETFKCGECGKATSFEVFRVPEYTRNGQPALSRNVKYSDGTMVDGVGKGDTMDGIPGKDATYTGYHYTKAVCETCGGINTNMSKSEYGYLKNVYWLYDCAAAFTQELDENVSYEYTDDTKTSPTSTNWQRQRMGYQKRIWKSWAPWSCWQSQSPRHRSKTLRKALTSLTSPPVRTLPPSTAST